MNYEKNKVYVISQNNLVKNVQLAYVNYLRAIYRDSMSEKDIYNKEGNIDIKFIKITIG